MSARQDFLLRQLRRRDLNQSGLPPLRPANVAVINAQLMAVSYPGSADLHRRLPQPGSQRRTSSPKSTITSATTDQFSARYSLYHVDSINSRGAGGLSAPSASANLFDTDQTIAASNIYTIISPRGERDPRAIHQQQSRRAAFRSHRTGREYLGRGHLRDFVGIAHGARESALRRRPTASPCKEARNAIRVGVDFLYNDDTITFPRTNRGSYSFSSLANFLSGTL